MRAERLTVTGDVWAFDDRELGVGRGRIDLLVGWPDECSVVVASRLRVSFPRSAVSCERSAVSGRLSGGMPGDINAVIG